MTVAKRIGIGVALGLPVVALGVCGGVVALGAVAAGGGALMMASKWEDGLRATLDAQTGGEVTFESLSLGWGSVKLHGVEVRRRPTADAAASQRLVRVEDVVLHADPAAFASTERWHVERVDVIGVNASVRLGPDGWELPETTMALIETGSAVEVRWPELTVGEVHVTDVVAVASSAEGDLHVVAASADVAGVSAAMDSGLKLHADEVVASGIDATAAGPIAHVDRVTLGTDGVARIEGAVVDAAVGRGGYPVLPPVVLDYAPGWMGGRFAMDVNARWFGVTDEMLALLPWKPDHAEVTDVTVNLTDGAMATEPVRWVAKVSRATAGPLSADNEQIPFAAEVAVAGGQVHVGGGLRSDGLVSVSVALDGGSAKAFAPYVRESLDHYGLDVVGGDASANLDATLLGSRLTAKGSVSASHLKFTKKEGGRIGVTAVAANAALGVLGQDRSYLMPVRVEGDLNDPGFNPVGAVVHGLEDKIFGEVGGSVRSAALAGAGQVGNVAKKGGQAVAGGVRDAAGLLKKDKDKDKDKDKGGKGR